MSAATQGGTLPRRIVIIGAGIAGASVAWTLAQTEAARQGALRVTLLEREAHAGYHSTGRSAAMFMASYGPPGARALTRASLPFYASPPTGFLSDAHQRVLSPRGVVYVARPGEADALNLLHDTLALDGAVLERWNAAQVLARVPCLKSNRVLAGLYERDASDMDVHALHDGYLRGARRGGCELRCDAEVLEGRLSLSPSQPAGPWTLRLSSGDALIADVVVNAAGAWCDTVAERFGVAPLGLQAKRRSAFTFEAPPQASGDPWPSLARWPLVASVDETEAWYFKPEAGGRLLGSPANADPTVPHDVSPEDLDIALGIDRIEGATHWRIQRPTSTWAGLRTFAPDGELVIGEAPSSPGFFWLAGQGGYGIQTAAAAANLAVAQLFDLPLPDALRRHGVDPATTAPQRLCHLI